MQATSTLSQCFGLRWDTKMRQHYYDPEGGGGFYVSDIHTDIPTTAVEITDEEYLDLTNSAAIGSVIKMIGAKPRSVPRETTLTTVELLAEHKQGRIAVLEDSVTPRRLREAVLTQEGFNWLESVEAEIVGVRALTSIPSA